MYGISARMKPGDIDIYYIVINRKYIIFSVTLQLTNQPFKYTRNENIRVGHGLSSIELVNNFFSVFMHHSLSVNTDYKHIDIG